MKEGSPIAPKRARASKPATSTSPKSVVKAKKSPTTRTRSKKVLPRPVTKSVPAKKTAAVLLSTQPKPVKSASGQTRTAATVTAPTRNQLPIQADRQPRSLALRSPFRFPLDANKIMTATARYGGLAFVVIGALFTVLNFPAVSNQVDFMTAAGTPAQVIATTSGSTTTTTTTTTKDTDSPLLPVENTITVNQAEPLRGIAELLVNTSGASRVELYVFTESWQNRDFLGVAEQIEPDVWHYKWDTTVLQSGLNYRVSAQIWQKSLHTNNPDVTIQTNYMLVDNTSIAEQIEAPVIETIDKTPTASVVVPERVVGEVDVTVHVLGATQVALILEHLQSGSRNLLYNATEVSVGTWHIRWPTTKYTNGEYRLTARVQNSYGTYVSGLSQTVVDNQVLNTSATPVIDDEIDTTLDTTPDTTDESAVPVVVPAVRLLTLETTTLMDTVQLRAQASVDTVAPLYFYIRDRASLESRFIGVGTRQSARDWSINWYTNNTPNGTYDLFVRAPSLAGTIESAPVRVSVQNTVTPQVSPVVVEQRQAVVTAVDEVVTSIPEAGDASAVLRAAPTATSDAAITTDAISPTESIFTPEKRTLIDAELLRLGTAHRNGDTEAVDRITDRIYLIAEAGDTSPNEISRAALRREVDAVIATYTVSVDRITALIRERGRVDVLRDTDGDGISDFDEVTIYNTDPLNPDTDNDGFNDGTEIMGGFDPLSDVREAVIVYASPKETGVYREDVLSVDLVTAIASISATSSVPDSPAETPLFITGRGLPYSFITLYIYSTPVIVTVRTDAEGAWQYRFDQELEDGEHNVYVGITDNAGRIVAKSQPYRFLKEAQAVTPLQAASLETMVTSGSSSSLLSGSVLYSIVAISVVAIGLVLIMLGWHLESRRKQYALTEGESLV